MINNFISIDIDLYSSFKDKKDVKGYLKLYNMSNNKDIQEHFKYFNDYNINNYLNCYIFVSNKKIETNIFDEDLYDRYHKEYLKFYSINPDIKIIVFTNSVEWCKQNFKFFNIYYHEVN